MENLILNNIYVQITLIIIGIIIMIIAGGVAFGGLDKKSKEWLERAQEFSDSADRNRTSELSGDWKKDSLRYKYLNYKKNKIGNPNEFKSIICPNCFKSVLIKELEISCPFCDENHGDKYSDIPKKIKQNVSRDDGQEIYSYIAEKTINKINENSILEFLYNECPKCHRKIRYINCYNCEGKIDLFASYDKNELERKSYG